ncbi:TonB-dependent receptor [Rhodohalobacter sp.]|uniref:TonB-dependent receptor n=1 Tax=Rhodohalobacter sp. TaxID=1974210 RepID=UPI002ACEB044|nr:TonB-dependent receptor [Rhodohalobacter sp.]MDZ7755533.1 TonB-dependent receptor [Rhodohalobacter sp.]
MIPKLLQNKTYRSILKMVSCVALLFVFTATQTFAQQGTVEGVISDTDNNPLPGANVVLVGENIGASTNPDGEYSISASAGNYTLQVSFLGYQTSRQDITISPGETLTLNVTLEIATFGGGEVVVLGTRRQGRTVTQSAVPVDVISAEEVQATGFTQTTAIIRALVPSFNSPESSITDGTDHVRPATLRGLGPDQTLVLINGKRRHTSAILHVNGSIGRGATGVDLNSIPANMIERIEVLRDGAAAQYGSDAIAGVINIVLKQSAGLDASFSYGQNVSQEERGYAPNQALPEGGTTAGFQSSPYYPGQEDVWHYDGKTVNLHLGYGFELPNNGQLYVAGQYRDRGITNRAGIDPRQNYPEVNGNPDPRELTFDRINHRYGSGDLLDVSGFFSGSMEVAADVELYAFGGISLREGETGGFYRRALDGRNVPEYYPDGFLPLITSNVYDGSFAAGLKGRTGEWSYDLSQVYGHNSINYGVTNSVNTSIGVGSPTTFKAGTLAFDQATTNLDFVRTADIGTAQPLSIALGSEFRYELYRIIRGEAESYADGGNGAAPGAQVFPGFSPRNEQNEDRYSIAAYADLETDIIEPWTVGVAGRLESYSDFGNTLTGKFSTRFEIVEGLAVRGAASTGFRAPSLAQSYFTSIATVFIDGTPFEVGTFPVNSDAAQALGAEPLEAETSVNLSAGATFERGNFSLTADLYRINIDDRVVFTENFTGEDLADFLQNQGINATGGRYFTNAVNTETQGIDIIARYGFNLADNSTMRFTLGMNFNETEITNKDEIDTPSELQGLTDVPLFGRVEIGRFEVGQPSSNINFMANYEREKWSVMLRGVRYGEIEAVRSDPNDDQVYGNIFTTDLEFTYSISDDVRLALGGNNIFDVYPDKTFQGNSFNGIFQYSGFSPSGFEGRYLYSRITMNF